jgi:hypothetical protein
MPLHDWSKFNGWSGMHLLWMNQLIDDIQPKLPAGFRAYLGTSPIVSVEDPEGEPDVSVHRTDPEQIGEPSSGDGADPFQPDREVVLATLERPEVCLLVEYGGRLIAAVELVSPGNRDGDKRRKKAVGRYLGYLSHRVHLLLVDVHPRQQRPSLADLIAAGLELPDEPPLPSPSAVSYRVGDYERGEGSWFAIRRRPLVVGQPLPDMPLALNHHLAVKLDLDGTYSRAARRAYLP